jgi:prepilin-type N-terminal cleavage/methylation domain-containing protein
MVRCKGFSLAELAVTMLIVSLLLAGALIPFGTQIDLKNVTDTQRTMESIREAIIGFSQANGRLPCPANGSIPAGTPTVGTEVLSGTACTNTFGVVPWATLGVPEADGWGRRFSYWVSPIFADGLPPAVTTFNTTGQSPTCTPTPMPTQSSFALCSLGNITVNTHSDTDHATVTSLGSALPAVIISHGKNGYGAVTSGGCLPSPSCSTIAFPAAGTDEAANATRTSAASTFYSRTPTPSASGCNDAAGSLFCEFDDIVVMITSNVLIARMVSAGRLP